MLGGIDGCVNKGTPDKAFNVVTSLNWSWGTGFPAREPGCRRVPGGHGDKDEEEEKGEEEEEKGEKRQCARGSLREKGNEEKCEERKGWGRGSVRKAGQSIFYTLTVCGAERMVVPGGEGERGEERRAYLPLLTLPSPSTVCPADRVSLKGMGYIYTLRKGNPPVRPAAPQTGSLFRSNEEGKWARGICSPAHIEENDYLVVTKGISLAMDIHLDR